ncbi:hypothetical protein LUZ60_008951 [Juncus effusus]|nr:hypothetical protein LUZ60_008951 [Juncus effusus]
MWKLKISEGDRFVRTCRGYLGREIWEFNEELGSSDERAAVERAREDGTLEPIIFVTEYFPLPLIQFIFISVTKYLSAEKLAKENNFDIMAKKSKPENMEGGEKNISASLQKAVNYLSVIQAKSGHWPGDLPGPIFMTTYLIIALYVTESLNFLSLEHQKELRRYLYNTQNNDGGWGLNVGGPSCMMSTSQSYISLRLLGEEAYNEKLYEARKWIHDHGGVTLIPSWGKIWLAVLGVYEWSGVNPLPPELFIIPSFLPIHPGKLFVHVRMLFSAMSYLYAKRFVGPITNMVLSLRNELHIQQYEKIDWNQARKLCSKEDRVVPHLRYRDYFNGILYKIYEPLSAYWPFKLARNRALKALENHMQYEDENSRYIWVSALQKSLFLVASWARDSNSNAFKSHLARVPDYLWVGEDGMKFKCCSSQLWDATFAVQAILACDFAKDLGRTLRKTHDFIKDSQILENPSGDFKGHFRHMTKGGWSFAIVDQQCPVSDCTAEALKALLLLSDISTHIVGEHIKSERLYDGVNFLLSLQNPDGGFATWELSRSYPWVEVFNTSEIFENIMQDYSYVECTSAAIQALALFKKKYPMHRRGEIEKRIGNAKNYVKNIQNDDGSWYGSWGLCFTYATWFGIEALVAVGKTYENSKSIRKACDFLLSKQLSDGGWGESYLSSFKKEYVHLEGNKSNVVNTAWAILALLKANQFERDPNPLHCAANYLIDMQLDIGDFPQQGMTGCFMTYGLMNYMMYRNIFPVWSLAEYHKKARFSKMN